MGGYYQLNVHNMEPGRPGAPALARLHQNSGWRMKGCLTKSRKLPLFHPQSGLRRLASRSFGRDSRHSPKQAGPLPLCWLPPRFRAAGAPSVVAAIERLNQSDAGRNCGYQAAARWKSCGYSTKKRWPGSCRFSSAVVSAVGHETDHTICDFVAAARISRPPLQPACFSRTGCCWTTNSGNTTEEPCLPCVGC